MYNFKKTTKLYIVENGNKHPVSIYPDLSASQTFDEQSYPKKTLHAQDNLHNGAVITKANTANFSFTSPINGDSTLVRLGTTYNNARLLSFDLYIEADTLIYKISNCIIENTVFNIERNSPVTMSISGSGSRLSKVASIPGTLVPTTQDQYLVIGSMNVVVGGVPLSSVASVHIEYVNEVSWKGYNTLHSSLSGSIAYPDSYVLSSRRVSGSITEFITDDNQDNLSEYGMSTPISIGLGTSSVPNTLFFLLPSTVFTRRLSIDEVFNRVYDFRLNTNSGQLIPEYSTTSGIDFGIANNSGYIVLF